MYHTTSVDGYQCFNLAAYTPQDVTSLMGVSQGAKEKELTFIMACFCQELNIILYTCEFNASNTPGWAARY